MRPNSLKCSRERRDLAGVAPVERRQRGQGGKFGFGGHDPGVAWAVKCTPSLAELAGAPANSPAPAGAKSVARDAILFFRSSRSSSARAQADCIAHEPLCPQGAHRARREEDRVPAGRSVAVGRRQSRARVQSAGQGAGAGARRRHAPLRLARHRRVPGHREPGVAAHPRAEPAAHRGAGAGKRSPTASATPRWRSCSRGGGRRGSKARTWIERQQQKVDAGVAETRARARREDLVQRRSLLARRHRDRLRARLSRPAPCRNSTGAATTRT